MTHSPIILDIAGTSLNADDRRRLTHPLVGGVIHFGRNWVSREQMLMLNAEIKSIRPDLLICVDHEGGRVQRFRTDGFTHLPPMRALGQAWMREDTKGPHKGAPGSGAMRALQAATACGYVLGAELRACGLDLSFAPVLDLDHGGSSVIGDRAFHADPRVVSLLAQNVMHGLLQAGMANCGKHFPGHGYAVADSHVATAVDKRSLKAILAQDAAPFAWLANSLSAVMPAHVIYPKVDDCPAGFSSRWLQDILRGQLGFGGAIFSDDLSMAAARVLRGEQLSPTQAAVAALNAGCDMVLLCNQSLGDGSVLDGLLDGLSDALTQSQWHASPDSEHRRLNLLPQTHPQGWHELMRSAEYVGALELVAALYPS
jgi:beta-N-acetylhexosaminidase